MNDSPLKDPRFLTPAMAEILLSQNLFEEASAVIANLREREINPAVLRDLSTRLEEIAKSSDPEKLPATGRDRVDLRQRDGALFLEWEVTPPGLALAKRTAKYSGRTVARVFRAVPGPRGVRTSYQDFETPNATGKVYLTGQPRSSICVAAVGFLSNTGQFIPLSSTDPMEVAL